MGEREAWFLAALLVVALRHIATQGRVLIKHGHRLGLMKHVHGTHAIRRRISQHLLMQRPRLHDVLCDLTLWR
jgi:hypothetical protein